jgi:hypothetical protein
MKQANWIGMILCLLMTEVVWAQQGNILSVKVSGQVITQVDSNRFVGVSYVTIYHKRRKTGLISDSSGFFSLSLLRGDTLLFSRIGYGTVTYILPNTYAETRLELHLLMQEKPYILREVKIRATQAPQLGPIQKKPVTVYVPPIHTVRSLQTAGLAPGGGLGKGPISALYDAFSKKAREKKLVAALMERDNKEKAYKARLNPEYVSELLRLEGYELDEFMAFCQPPIDFVLNAEEYELIVMLLDCHKRFLQRGAYYIEK